MRYTLMHKRLPVAELEIDQENTGLILAVPEVYAWEHLPVGVEERKRQGRREVDPRSLNEWWAGRSIPASRSGLREALDILKVPQALFLLTRSFALSLSDQYWVNRRRQPLRWEDVNFFQNDFSSDVGDALFGREPSGNISLLSPDNTSDGWLQKKWVIADGKRLLLKGGSGPFYQEPLNEVIASSLMRRLGVPHAEYRLAWERERPLSACEDFVSADTDLVSAWRIMSGKKKPNHLSTCQFFLRCCQERGIPGAPESLNRLLAVDYLMVNEDRHFNNFGALRRADTLEWLGMAPLFDTGTSLWYNRLTEMIFPTGAAASKPFRKDHGEQIKLVSSFSWLDLAALDGFDAEAGDILKESPRFIGEERRAKLRSSLQARVEMLARFSGRA